MPQFLRTLVAVLAGLLFGMPLIAIGQGNPPADAMSQDQLDGLLAPIALYPDELLTQVLMASTYPLEVVEAARFVKANPSLKGPSLDDALKDKTWDPSVQSLVPFPQVLDMMNEKLEWTQRLGDAFLADEASVMRTVQALRLRAQQAGNLQSTEQQRVYAQDQAIVIEPAQPQYVYVPVYNPTVIYGAWWAPAYLPWYWYPPPIWGYPPRPPGWGYAPGFYWGTAWAINRNYWGWARPNWRGNNINININNNYWGSRPGYRDRYPNGTGNWSHAPEHRKGVAYRDAATYNKYRPTNSTGVDRRENYRGNPGSQPYRPGTPAGNAPATRPTSPGLGQPGTFPTNPSTGQPGTRPANPSVGQPATRPVSPGLGQPGAFPTNPSTGQPGTRPTNPSVGQPATRPVSPGLGQPGSFPTNPSAGQPGTRPTNPSIGQPATRPTTPGGDRPTSRPMPSQPPSRPQQTFQTQSRPQVQAESNRGQASRQNMNQQTGQGNAGGGGGGGGGGGRGGGGGGGQQGRSR